MQIAAVQTDIRWEDRAGNYARVRELLRTAKLSAGTLVVLPEMFDVGFSMNKGATDPGAESASDTFCREVAAEHRVAVLAGVVARAGEGKLANEAIAIAPDGAELARYRKMRPFSLCGEPECYPGGSGHSLFKWQDVQIAPFICYDLRFPELFRPAAAAGAELLVVIANWPEARSDHWVALLRARAIENQAWVLGVNRIGSDPTLRYNGRSCLFDPHGHTVFELGVEETVQVAEVDPVEAQRWRAKFPALGDMRK